MNTQFQKKAGRRWTRRSPDGHTRNEIDYILTDKPSMVTDVTVINRIDIGSDHRMVIGRAGTNTPSDEYDTYRDTGWRIRYVSRIHFFSEAKLGNW